MIDLDSIHLTKEERIALRRLKAGKEVSKEIGFRLWNLSLALCKHLTAGEGFYISLRGERWLDNYRAKRRDVLWTRGLAIASIIISLAALAVASLSLYLQFRPQ